MERTCRHHTDEPLGAGDQSDSDSATTPMEELMTRIETTEMICSTSDCETLEWQQRHKKMRFNFLKGT